MGDPLVVGTAGHVDHGKTALVHALTGVDCDRLREEKARGITIELGFARWDVADGHGASVIDVPGHERFVGTMVAGATGIDCVLMVVAADDGVMPQTREHLAICELLGIRRGVIAVTKCDLASDDWIEVVEEDIRASTRGTFLEGAEIVRCSAVDRRGLAALGAAVARVCSVHTKAASGPAFVAIDRVFSRPGAGTVVTGTLARGGLAVGDAVDVLPTREGAVASLRIRAMERFGRPIDAARASTRLALNLRGDGADAIRRGTVVVAPGSAAPTMAVHAEVALLSELGSRAEVTVHLGTSAVTAAVQRLDRDRDRLEPADGGVVLLRARTPFATFAGQRFVLRRSGRRGSETIGGGIVLDPHPRRARRRGAAFFFAGATPRDRVHALVVDARYSGITLDEIERRTAPDDAAATRVGELTALGAIALSGGRFFDAAVFASATASLVELVGQLHRERPLVAGVAGGELETRSPERYRPLVPAALAALVENERLVVADGLYRAPEHRSAEDRERILEQVRACFGAAALAPPTDEAAASAVELAAGAFKDAAAELRRRGALRLVGGFHFDTAALASLQESVARWFESHDTLTPPDFKRLSGAITRRHAIPLLEWLDRERVTVRRGDARVAGTASRPPRG